MQRSQCHASRAEAGYTLIELLLVVLILGVLASVVVFAVSDMRADASSSSCDTDRRTLATAAEAYFAENRLAELPESGSGDDRYEQALVDAGYLRDVSAYFDLAADGSITADSESEC